MADDNTRGLADQLAPYAGRLAMFDEAEAAFKPGVESEYDEGVAFFAPWEDPFSGFPEHARRCAWAIWGPDDNALLATHLRSTEPNAQWEGGKHRVALRKKMRRLTDVSIKRYLAQIYMLVPSRSAVINLVTHAHLEPEQLAIVNRFKVLYHVWERQWISPDFARALDRVGQIWCANSDNAAMLRRAGIDERKIEIIRCPYFEDDPLLALDGRDRTLGPVRFYHIGKWEPRKCQHQIIGAFLKAFNPGQAMLMLKTSAKTPTKVEGYPSGPEASLAEWLDDRWVQSNGWNIERVQRFVSIKRTMLSASQIVEMHRMGDVYVSMSRGEGVDMPAFDAKLAGNLMVYVPSGPQDFAGSEDERVQVAGLVPCHPFYNWEDGATYNDYRINDAVAAMKRAYQKVLAGKRCRGVDLTEFSAAAVGAKMRAAIARLCETP